MLLQEPNLNVWLYNRPTDMRKQFDGLSALAQSKMNCQTSSGDLFVFINRKRTYMKVLYYSKGGYCLWSKRLEQGRFHQVCADEGNTDKLPLNWVQLQCLIDGINWQKAAKNKRLVR
jgi:transposase